MNPLKGWQVDRSQICTIGTGLQRPECILAQRDGAAIGVTLLSSDMGKLYVALAQAIERLRT